MKSDHICTVKLLQQDQWVQAAAKAVAINPTNAPAEYLLRYAAPDAVIPPEHLALLISKFGMIKEMLNMYIRQLIILTIFSLILLFSGGCNKQLIKDNVMFMKQNICVKFVDTSDNTLFTGVLSDANQVKTLSSRIIKKAQEDLNDELIGSIGENWKGNIDCENKKIYVLKIKLDSIESESNLKIFSNTRRTDVIIKYTYILENENGKDIFKNETNDSDEKLSDLAETIGEKIAKKIVEFNYNEQRNVKR